MGSKPYCFFKRQCGLVAERHSFFMTQHCFVTSTICSVTMQRDSESGEPCFFPEVLCSVTKTLASEAEACRSEPDQPVLRNGYSSPGIAANPSLSRNPHQLPLCEVARPTNGLNRSAAR